MIRVKAKRLAVSRETVRALTGVQLGRAAGGAPKICTGNGENKTSCDDQSLFIVCTNDQSSDCTIHVTNECPFSNGCGGGA